MGVMAVRIVVVVVSFEVAAIFEALESAQALELGGKNIVELY